MYAYDKDSDGKANNADPDQGAEFNLGLLCFPQTPLSKESLFRLFRIITVLLFYNHNISFATFCIGFCYIVLIDSFAYTGVVILKSFYSMYYLQKKKKNTNGISKCHIQKHCSVCHKNLNCLFVSLLHKQIDVLKFI